METVSAMELYQKGRVSLSKAAEIAGMSIVRDADILSSFAKK